MFLKASLKEYQLPLSESGNRSAHTRNVYNSMLKQYMEKSMLRNFFNRAVKNSFDNLTSIEASVASNKPVQMTKKRSPSKAYLKSVQHQISNQTQYRLPDAFVNIYEDLKEAKKEAAALRKLKKTEWDLKKIIGLNADDDVPSWSKSSSRLLKKKSTSEQNEKNAEEKYSDKDIKQNWKTLMHFSKRTWSKSTRPPIPQHEINSEKMEQFFIGRSDIKNKKVYFIVSSNIIPRDQKSFVFEDSFFAKMAYNTEYDIPQHSINKLNEVVRDAKNYVIGWIQPCVIDGVKMWRGKKRIGSHTDPQNIDWIKDSFLPAFKPFYDECLDDNNIGKHLPVPNGKRTFEIADASDQCKVIPVEFKTEFSVPFTFDNDAYCAFGNMANALSICEDNMAARFFFANRHKHMPLLTQEYPELKLNLNGNQFHCALQIVRHMFKYNIKRLENTHEPWKDVDTESNVVKYVEIEQQNAAFSHVVCIFKNFIYDGSLTRAITLSYESMLWLCHNEQFYLKCYTIEPCKKVKRALQSKKNPIAKKTKK